MPRALLPISLIVFAAAACSGDEPLHPRPTCPPLPEWTAEASDTLADEIDAHATFAPMMVRAVSELYVLRRQCRFGTPEP